MVSNQVMLQDYGIMEEDGCGENEKKYTWDILWWNLNKTQQKQMKRKGKTFK